MDKKRTKKEVKIQKSNDPAFLFYFKSWLARATLLSKTTKSDWIDLMCYQANKGFLTLDEIKKVCGSDFEKTWSEISVFFTEKNGLFFDKKLIKVLKDRKAYCESRRKNALGNNRLERKHMLSVCAAHFLIYSRNKNKNKNNSFSLSFSLSQKDKDCFVETFMDFCKMRAEINRKITKKGMEILLKKLHMATEDISLQIKILEHSINTSSPDIYPETVLKKFGNLPILRDRLSVYLPENSISKILDLCPNLTLDYINRKIELLQSKRPDNPESYLYNAITKDYSPDNSHVSKDASKPITKAEYDKLSPELKKKLKQVEHISPAKSVWKLMWKPERELMKHEEFALSSMSVGDVLEDKFYEKVPDTLKNCFETVQVPLKKEILYHWI